jgi:hypothetical protein
VRIQPASREQIVADLARAGLSAAEIEELLALARAEPAGDVPGGALEEPAPLAGVKAAPPMPPQLEALLRMMASGGAPEGAGREGDPSEGEPSPEGAAGAVDKPQ